MRVLGVVGLLMMATVMASAAEKRPMKIEDLFAFARVADPQVSPDGKLVVYQVTTVSLEANKSSTALWLAATDNVTAPRQFTFPQGKKDTHPRWSPDGTKILFESTRSGTSQLYTIGLTGGEAERITNISTGASTGLWSPDGKHIAFVSTISPEFSELPFAESDKKNAEKDKATEENPVKAKTFTKLFFRHWDSYVEDKRQHLFVIDAGQKGWSEPRNVTPGDRDAYPTSSTFSVGDDFTFTPDSQHIIFAATPEKGEAWSTNMDLCRVKIDNKSTKWESLTAANKAADNSPRFSPDGKRLAWRAQKKAGYEADQWQVMVVSVEADGKFTSEPSELFKGPHSVNEFIWSSNGNSVEFTADREGSTPIFAQPQKGGLTHGGGQNGSLSRVVNGTGFVFTHASMDSPPEVWVKIDPINNANAFQLTHHNDALLADLNLAKPETVQVKIEDGEMQMWVLKPPGFDPKKKWPVAYLVHGGPQGAWEDGWSYRWNPQIWAAQGYVVVMPNPRGSTGFGQKFVDQISGDWGGKCYRDLVAGLEYTKALPYVDKDRMGSAGASFGGYMQNWFAVNEIAKEFKCLITHCSVYNFESMWGTTEELWFDEYEHGGLPWEIPGKYREFSPHTKAGNMGKYKTPMLIIHNDLDFRCPIGQGHELFTALQRQGVPSRFVNFPDECHWVLKPKNSQHWHKEVFAWLTKHVPPGGK
ncbi:MAG: prolyl oligopeptidase family serine peptidase [Fimbriiglobus sp.]